MRRHENSRRNPLAPFTFCNLVANPAEIDRGLWLYGAWLREARTWGRFFVLILQALHMPLAPLLAWATILTELIGGFAILIGAFVPLASVPMAIVLLVAIVTVHLPNGFSSIKLQAVTSAGAHFGQPGYETDLLYLACLAALVLGGAGPLSIDTFLMRRRQTQIQ